LRLEKLPEHVTAALNAAIKHDGGFALNRVNDLGQPVHGADGMSIWRPPWFEIQTVTGDPASFASAGVARLDMKDHPHLPIFPSVPSSSRLGHPIAHVPSGHGATSRLFIPARDGR
jgi:hypothetical protein